MNSIIELGATIWAIGQIIGACIFVVGLVLFLGLVYMDIKNS